MPEWKTIASCSASNPLIMSPFLYASGYPFEASTTPITASSDHCNVSSLSSNTALHTSTKSFSKRGNTTSVSGSPKRALNSITFDHHLLK